jgi:diketogulonate reductase-like aldo/keto reductase
MLYKKLGNTSKVIPVIGQGTMGIGGRFSSDRSNDKSGIAALKHGVSCGLSFVDTAEAYGGGHSEELIGRVRDIFVASKVSPENLNRKNLIAACEASLKRLKRNHIDLYQIHWPNPDIPIEETAEALNILKKQGKIRFIGVSNFTVQEIVPLMEMCEISSAQSEYNLFDRTVESKLLPYCQENKITFIAYTPLDFGRSLPILKVLSKKYDSTPQQIALKWLVDKGVVAIPKSINLDHIKSNAESVLLDIDPDDSMLLDSLHGELQHISTKEIACDSSNLENFVPSFQSLGESLKSGIPMKPIRVKKQKDRFELTEGKIRYWAWRHAFGDHPCPTLIRE